MKPVSTAILHQTVKTHLLPALLLVAALLPAGALAALCGVAAEGGNVASALMQSIRTGDAQSVRCLLDAGADANTTEHDITALALAASLGSAGSCLLPEEGASAPVAVTPAIRMEITRLLLAKGAKVNAADKAGTTALMDAARLGYADTARLLIQHGAKVNAAAKGSLAGITALMFAAMYGHTATVRLLTQHGANVNAATRDGITALMLAAMDGHTDTARLLIAHGAKVNAKDKSGETALGIAKKGKHASIVDMLRAAGAKE